jgi:hypothetical protein
MEKRISGSCRLRRIKKAGLPRTSVVGGEKLRVRRERGGGAKAFVECLSGEVCDCVVNGFVCQV